MSVLASDQIARSFRTDISDIAQTNGGPSPATEKQVSDLPERLTFLRCEPNDEVVLPNTLVDGVHNLTIEGFADLLCGVGGAETDRREFRMAVADWQRSDQYLSVGVDIASAGQALEFGLNRLGDITKLGQILTKDIDCDRSGRT